MNTNLTKLTDAGLNALIEYLFVQTSESRVIHERNTQQLIDALKESVNRLHTAACSVPH